MKGAQTAKALNYIFKIPYRVAINQGTKRLQITVVNSPISQARTEKDKVREGKKQPCSFKKLKK